jgi:hypothetical protein
VGAVLGIVWRLVRLVVRVVLLIVLVALIANYGSHLAQHRHALPRVIHRTRYQPRGRHAHMA